MNHQHLFEYVLQLADNANVLSHRLGQWCGHGPVIEQDIAMTNLALDLIGQARNLYQYAATIEGKGRTEDDMAYLRDGWDFYNLLLTELPNGDFGKTVARQFLYDTYALLFYSELKNSPNEMLAAIAEKSLKETAYHYRWSSEWVIRLGDGTEESHRKMQEGLNEVWRYTDEIFQPVEREKILIAAGVLPDLAALKPQWEEKVRAVIEEATLSLPEAAGMQYGGKTGRHTEALGYILAEMQYMQRAYPGLEW